MADPLEISKLIINLAYDEPDEAEMVSHLRLQKLLYYAQAWSLAIRGNPIFAGRIEAWKHGPTIPSVYRHYKHFDRQPLPREDPPVGLTEDECRFIRSVWQYYKQFSATRLRAMTHMEAPWLEARGDCPQDGNCENEISHQSMKDYFLRVYEQEHIPGLELSRLSKVRQERGAEHRVSLSAIADGIRGASAVQPANPH